MKCGIITYHFANNYGAMLQCFALKEAIEEMGHSANVINYISDKQYDNNSVFRKNQGIKGYIKNLLLLPFIKKRRRREVKFVLFRNQMLGCNKDRIRTNKELENHINLYNYDVVISGSDQVWSPNVFDFEDSFFYPFDLNAKKIGYAVSVGNTSIDQLEKYACWIEKFEEITVREVKTSKIINELIGRVVIDVADPVILLDKDTWWGYIKEKKERYMVCYFVREEDMKVKIANAKRLARKLNLNLKIINLRISRMNLYNRILLELDPFEFLTEIANAEYIYTDSFHGTVFSIIFEKNFTVVESMTEKNDSRKRNVLEKLNLENRLKKINNSSEILGRIDYLEVTDKVNIWREESKAILREMLSI